MKSILKFLKVIFLTIITFGLYGYYWLYTNLFAAPDDPNLTEEEKKAKELQNAYSVGWLFRFINIK